MKKENVERKTCFHLNLNANAGGRWKEVEDEQAVVLAEGLRIEMTKLLYMIWITWLIGIRVMYE